MAITLLSHTKKSGGGSSPAINTVGATVLIVALNTNAGSLPPGDSLSNSWTASPTYTGSFTSETTIWWCFNPNTGASHTFDIGLNAGGSALCVAAFSGTVITGIDNGTGVSNQPSPVSTGALTPSANNAICIACTGGQQITSATTVNGGFTISDDNLGVVGVTWGITLAYLIQTTAASANPAFTFTSSGGNNAAILIIILPATAGVTRVSRLTALGVGS